MKQSASRPLQTPTEVFCLCLVTEFCTKSAVNEIRAVLVLVVQQASMLLLLQLNQTYARLQLPSIAASAVAATRVAAATISAQPSAVIKEKVAAAAAGATATAAARSAYSSVFFCRANLLALSVSARCSLRLRPN